MTSRIKLGFFALLFGVIIPNIAFAATYIAVQDQTNKSYVLKINSDGSINVTGGSGSNPSVSTNGAAGPTSATQIGSRDGSGNLQPASTANPIPIAGPVTNAGTFPIQLNASNGDALTDTGNALDVNVKSGASVAQSSTTSGQTGSLIQGAVTTSPPTYTTAKTNPLSLATDGSLRTQNEGMAASGASAVGNPLLNGCRAATAAPTAVTDGQAIANECGAEGKQINLPYSIKELMLRGAASGTSGAITLTGMGAQGASVKIYITSAQCFRTDAGSTLAYVTLNDSASTTLPIPAGGGSVTTFSVPLVLALNTGVTFTPSATISTVFCNAQGYVGP